MKTKIDSRVFSLTIVIAALGIAELTLGVERSSSFFPSFADKHTVGLWLFDETDYPYTTLTDASQYEYDLRLMKGGKLVPGKFGNCLKLTPGLDYAVGYAAWKGMVSFTHMREVSGRRGSGLWGPTVAPEKLLNALSGRDFTCEFWLLLMSNPIQDVVLIDLGDKYEPGLTLTLKTKAAGFVIENAYAGFKAECPTVLNQIWGRAWHHIAFTYSAGNGRLQYFIDGKSQGSVPVSAVSKTSVPVCVWPESLHHTTYGVFKKENRTDKPDFEKRRKNRFNFALGHDRHGDHDFNGNIDELRFSDVTRCDAVASRRVRYSRPAVPEPRRGRHFPLPDSFSRNYRADGPTRCDAVASRRESAVANGPHLPAATRSPAATSAARRASRRAVWSRQSVFAQ